ncbi:MAG: glycine cleavage system aminomethyltransferase GcvT [Actinobacteria bacterium]|nr:glycine cleavage system aminomethyltransferase GcvT [Actinomycetota bacterium]
MTDRRSPLDEVHRAAGARMVPFGGWEMPLQYATGTLAEHRACRGDAVVFDVSHLGAVVFEGPEAHDRIQSAFTNDLDRIAPGRAQYTHLLDDADASVLDDIIVWWVDPETFIVMPNASNTDRVIDALGSPSRDVTTERVVLALQGPRVRERIAAVFPEAAEVGRFRVARLVWNGNACIVAGTGYTGEDGIEVHVPAAGAAALWAAVVDAGFTPAGLGARDTLRLEAGLPLHGHELGPGITPLQAGLGWVVGWAKGDFRGRGALEAERDAGIARHLVGIRVPGRRPPRADRRVTVEGRDVGVVTSGNFSPSLETGIALALVEVAVVVGDEVSISTDRDMLDGVVVDLPFLDLPSS